MPVIFKKKLSPDDATTHKEQAAEYGELSQEELDDFRDTTRTLDLSDFEGKELEVVKKFISMNDDMLSEFVPTDPERKGGNRISSWEKEARLVYLQRLMIRQLTVEEISKELKISPRMVLRLKAQLRDRTKQSISSLDFGLYAGETFNFYREVRGMSMLLASHSKVSPNSKISALNTAMRSESELQKFFALSGVFDAVAKNNPMVESMITGMVQENKQDENTMLLDRIAGFLEEEAAEILHTSATGDIA
jgi:hypothetical protein